MIFITLPLRGTGKRILRQKADFLEKNECFEMRKAPPSAKIRHSCIRVTFEDGFTPKI